MDDCKLSLEKVRTTNSAVVRVVRPYRLYPRSRILLLVAERQQFPRV